MNAMRLGDFYLTVVEFIEGIARRIYPQLLFSITGEHWELAQPQRNLGRPNSIFQFITTTYR